MRLVMFQGGDGAPALGAVTDKGIMPVGGPNSGDVPDSMLPFIDAGPDAWAQARRELASTTREPFSLDDATVMIGAPIARPRRNVFCVGLNYRAHAAEAAAAQGQDLVLPEYPSLFTKPSNTVIGPDAVIEIVPAISERVDWEVELAIVIGVGGRDIPASKALDHVFGYTVGNDISARDVQARHGGQYFKGKSFDTFCPIGPWIVTADEIPDPGVLGLRLRVNGVEKQNSNTRDLIFGVPAIIESLSQGLTLEAGDIILTGTPEGVGFARTPPEFLKDGDVVEAEIEQIGVLRNTVRART
jgi:2-keto-4-pentenoate hydratase/2-oxohepta-3-ene-1,7-dioic acid hydratase in catechol pathway